jgi:hypothetical protein
MRPLAEFLSQSLTRLEALAVRAQPSRLCAPTNAGGFYHLPADDPAENAALDALNTADLDAAILYLQNRYTPFELMQDSAERALEEHPVAANDTVLAVCRASEESEIPDFELPRLAPVSETPCSASALATATDYTLFGCTETSLFHAGHDWIALEGLEMARAPAA